MSKCKVTIISANGANLVSTGIQGEVDEIARTYERYLVSDEIKTFVNKTPGSVVVVQTCNVLAIRVEPDNRQP